MHAGVAVDVFAGMIRARDGGREDDGVGIAAVGGPGIEEGNVDMFRVPWRRVSSRGATEHGQKSPLCEEVHILYAVPSHSRYLSWSVLSNGPKYSSNV